MSAKNKSSRGNWTASLSTIIGIALVLFMLGVLSLIVLNTQKLSEYFRENVSVQVFFENATEEATVQKVKGMLEAEPFTKEAVYVSSEEAAELMQQEVGEDFIEFLGFHPIPPSLDLKIRADYAKPDSLVWMAKEMAGMAQVQSVEYPKELLEKVNKNINKLGIVILIVSAILLLVAVALINNTIRLAIYSKRFLIKSMQLVGATYAFITRPFIWKGVLHGIIAGALALLLIVGLLFAVKKNYPDIFELTDLVMFAKLFGIVFALAILISWISTRLAVRKYIRMRQDQLY